MAKERLPKVGDKIPIEKFHVSKMNMRYEEPFPAGEEDEILIANLRARRGKTAELIMARPESDGYGVYQGRRKFLGLKMIELKELVVGEHTLIKNVSDEEAADASWTENVDFLRKTVDPITRAKKLSERQAFSGFTLRQLAAHDGVGVSTYSEWLLPLKLTEKMQDCAAKGLLTFSDTRTLAKMELGEETQDRLAEVLEKQGLDTFKEELMKIPEAREHTRGIPAGAYEIIRLTYETGSDKDMRTLGIVNKAAEKKGMEPPEYVKDFLGRKIEEIRKEAA